jgi:hypothetical protein
MGLDVDDALKACGEELQNDLWKYSLKRRIWQKIKIDYNHEIYTALIAPVIRVWHAGIYAELKDAETIMNNNTAETLIRKYLYIYGGFSIECTSACFDTWRYEIAYAPYTYYPNSASTFNKPGNYWEVVHNDFNSSPGRRFRHSMVSF